jgi:hypothetical protein
LSLPYGGPVADAQLEQQRDRTEDGDDGAEKDQRAQRHRERTPRKDDQTYRNTDGVDRTTATAAVART